MSREHLADQEAFDLIHAHGRRTRQSLVRVARDIVEGDLAVEALLGVPPV